MGIWLGGINGVYLEDKELENTPAIAKLAKDFQVFQNGPYRGEWDQKWTLTFGQIRDILCEISRFIQLEKDAQGDAWERDTYE